jgi:hypothetical protein
VGTNKRINPLWFFHIPKTAGRFFYANTIRIIEQEFVINGKQYGELVHGAGHLSFKPLDNGNILSFSTLREPVARTISHFQHLYQNQFVDDIEIEKHKMLNFLFDNPTKGIINFQTKFSSYSGDEYMINIDEHELKDTVDETDLALAKKRFASIDYVFKSDGMNHKITQKSLDIMRKHFDLTATAPYFETTIHKIVNQNSAKMYEYLTKKEKSMIEDLMKFDMELYNSTNFVDVDKL